jgi:hypothetical protein
LIALKLPRPREPDIAVATKLLRKSVRATGNRFSQFDLIVVTPASSLGAYLGVT